jgi:hypothetical protein
VSFTQLDAAVVVGGGGLDLPGPVTFEGWGRMDAPLPASGFQRLFNKGGEFNRPLTLWVSDAAAPMSTFGEYVLGVNYEEITDYLELPYVVPGFGYMQWHHYAAVVGGPGDEAVLFVDGERVASATFAFPIETGHPNVYFGNWDVVGESRLWNGAIDEFRFSDEARTDAWILASYRTQATSQAFCTVATEEQAIVP